MKRFAVAGLFWLLLASPAEAELRALVVQGLGGDAQWSDRFGQQATGLFEILERSGARGTLLTGEAATREELAAQIRAIAAQLKPVDQMVTVLVGHGSFDGEEYKFNIPGPDVTGSELLQWLQAMPSGKQVLINTTSASGALLGRPQDASNLILLTATKNGRESQATRFAGYLLSALGDAGADQDKNGSITVQEAFAYASRGVSDEFSSANQLATEHSRLEGTGADRFNLTQLAQSRPAAVAGTRHSELLRERASLDEKIAALRQRRDQLPPDEYLTQLQQLLVELALINNELEALP